MTRILVIWLCGAGTVFGQPAIPLNTWEGVPASAIQVKNRVARCLQLEPRNVEASGAIIKLIVDGTFARSTGDCGCTSALLRYRVTRMPRPQYREELVSALLSTKSAGPGEKRRFEFVISGDTAIPYAKGVSLDLTCAPPD